MTWAEIQAAERAIIIAAWRAGAYPYDEMLRLTGRFKGFRSPQESTEPTPIYDALMAEMS